LLEGEELPTNNDGQQELTLDHLQMLELLKSNKARASQLFATGGLSSNPSNLASEISKVRGAEPSPWT
jgi:hypothetical protein